MMDWLTGLFVFKLLIFLSTYIIKDIEKNMSQLAVIYVFNLLHYVNSLRFIMEYVNKKILMKTIEYQVAIVKY